MGILLFHFLSFLTSAKPTILTNYLSEVSYPLKESISFTCDVEGNPAPTVGWYYEGGVLRDTDEINGTNTSLLTIPSLEEKHVGLYQCRVDNKLGFDTVLYYLTIQPLGKKILYFY